MFRIYRFSLIYTFKKKTTWIFLGLISLAVFGLTYLTGKYGEVSSDVPRLYSAFSGNMAIQFYIFFSMLLMSYIAIKTSNIFKDGESDGSTLLLVSKEFTRSDIVFGKAFAVITHIFFAAIFATIGITLSDIILKGPSGIQYILSLFVGTIIIGSLFASIVMLFAINFAKMGTLFISVAIAVLLPISSILVKAFTGGMAYLEAEYSIVATLNEDNKITTGLRYTGADAFTDDESDKAAGPVAKSQKYNGWKVLDIWEQISSPLTMFVDGAPVGEYLSVDVLSDEEVAKWKDSNSFSLERIDSSDLKDDNRERYTTSLTHNMWNQPFSFYDYSTNESTVASMDEVNKGVQEIIDQYSTAGSNEYAEILEGILKNVEMDNLDPGGVVLNFDEIWNIARWVMVNYDKDAELLHNLEANHGPQTSLDLKNNSADWISGAKHLYLDVKNMNSNELEFFSSVDDKKLSDDGQSYWYRNTWAVNNNDPAIALESHIVEYAFTIFATNAIATFDERFADAQAGQDYGYTVSKGTADTSEVGNYLTDYISFEYKDTEYNSNYLVSSSERLLSGKLTFTPYFNKAITGIVWSIIALALLGLSVGIYYRRDFQ